MTPCTLILLLALALSHQTAISSAADNDLNVHNLLDKLYSIQDLVVEVRRDIAHKIGHIDSSTISLEEAGTQLKSISLQSLSLTNATIDRIQTKTDSARLRIMEVKEQMSDLKQLQKAIRKLKDVEADLMDLTVRIEDELESQESDTTSTIVLQQQIASIVAELKKQQEKEALRQLPYEIIEAIQTREFGAANAKLALINEDNKMVLIVRMVYNHQAVNFPLMMEFARFLTNKTKTYVLVKAVRGQLIENRHDDATRNLELKKVADTIGWDSVQASEKDGVEALKGDLRSAVVSKAKDEVKAALKEKAHRKGPTKEMLRIVYDYDNNMFRDAIRLALDDAYNDIDVEFWLELARDSAYIEQIIITTVYVWERMGTHNERNDVKVMNVGFTVRESQEQGNINMVNEDLRKQLEKIKDELPFSIKNAVFSDKVCFKNVKYGEYMYAPGDHFKYDEDRRNVFSWFDKTHDDTAEFKVERYDNQYYIRNIKYNEYLYAANDFFIKFDRRRSIYTWMRGGRVTNGVWFIEPDGEDCYIKVTEYNEYLISGDDEKKFDNDRRRVFGALGGKRSEEAKWRIEAC